MTSCIVNFGCNDQICEDWCPPDIPNKICIDRKFCTYSMGYRQPHPENYHILSVYDTNNNLMTYIEFLNTDIGITKSFDGGYITLLSTDNVGSFPESWTYRISDIRIWSINIYYITQNNNYDPDYENKIYSAMSSADILLDNYNNMRLTWVINRINVPSTINIKQDISGCSWHSELKNGDCWVNETVPKAILNNIPNFIIDYGMYDITFIVIANTTGGAYVINLKSPIWFSGQTFNNNNAGILVLHEFLHTFGLNDVNEGQPGCIMGDLTITTLNLCDQAYKFKPENYGKTSIGDLL